jgi:hypothetical protein
MGVIDDGRSAVIANDTMARTMNDICRITRFDVIVMIGADSRSSGDIYFLCICVAA